MGQLVPMLAVQFGMAAIENREEKQIADETREQLKAKANEDAALAQRKAIRERRRGERIMSRARAIAAASGGGTDNLTVERIEGGLQDDTDFNVLSALYEGETREDSNQLAARLLKRRTRASNRNRLITAGAQTLYDKYS